MRARAGAAWLWVAAMWAAGIARMKAAAAKVVSLVKRTPPAAPAAEELPTPEASAPAGRVGELADAGALRGPPEPEPMFPMASGHGGYRSMLWVWGGGAGWAGTAPTAAKQPTRLPGFVGLKVPGFRR